MDPRTQERVEQWDSRSFSGGYDGLADLAAADFSGAVDAAGTWLFMLNGRIVGVLEGAIEDFENASGTVYEAPHPSLPLLCTMEERGGETRANYYTNETPLREVDQTLQDGSFTGYIVLSENVLSGDYYAVYYGGRRMAAAYIGTSERLLTGDEAFERADDEVGIYEVIDVEIDVTDVPGTNTSDSAGDGSASSDSTAGRDTEAESTSDAATGSTVDAPTETEADASTEPRAEPSANPTESAIESIDLSGSDTTATDETAADTLIEDVSLDDTTADSSELEDEGEDNTEVTEETDETDDLSGITTSDEQVTEPVSNGITDARLSADADTDASDSPQSGQEPAPDTTPESDDERTQATEPSTDSVPAETDTVDSDDGQPQPDTESADSSGPDLAEVEAAAEQLEQNDISWTEDDIESQSEDDASADDPDPDVLAETPAQSEPQSEQSTSEENENEVRFEAEAQWRETRSIPSIDPDNSETADPKRDPNAGRRGGNQQTNTQQSSIRPAASKPDNRSRDTATASADSSANPTQKRSKQQHSAQQQDSQRSNRADADTNSTSGTTTGTQNATDSSSAQAQAQDQRVAELAQRIETLEAQRDKLTATAEELEAERDQLRSENQELASTIDRLQSRITELETELERTREAAADAGESATDTPTASTQLSPEQALADTNLFVRYTSKSQPTLETAHDGQADRNEVASNLRLEHHTGFDASDVAVGGAPYEEFLPATMEHQFIDWLTEMVLYEIRDTGNADALADLYDAIPRIDRAELNATISLADDETEDVPDEVTFDVVAFDKMGNPLVVANLNDSREPATQDMLEEMEEAASAVKANYPDLAAAVVVTSSYFEPGALEVAEQATSGGFLSRGSKLSYVNLSRKQGYHLCLVESRSEGFHMNVPEL